MVSEVSPEFPGTPKDLVTECPACQGNLAIPDSLLGQLVECPFCQHHFTLPGAVEPSVPAVKSAGLTAVDREARAAQLSSMEGQLRENASQITELRGHVSRLNMELHRHQLRMKDLSERQAELHGTIAAAKSDLGIDA